MVKHLLGCPHCGEVRFTRLAPPYREASEARCAGCRREVTLAQLETRLFSPMPAPAGPARTVAFSV